MSIQRSKQIFKSSFFALLLLALSVDVTAKDLSRKGATDAEVKRAIIAESIRSYPGNCPCPYNRARNGSSCGRRSAWSRRGGHAPICYESEVSRDMVIRWRQRHGQTKSK